MTSIPYIYKIKIGVAEVEQLQNDVKSKNIGFWLRYHRLSRNLSMQALIDELGLSYPSYIKNLEGSLAFPSRDVSMKLAEYFKLDTKYFYDPYFEDTDDYDKKLYNYRITNNLTIDDICLFSVPFTHNFICTKLIAFCQHYRFYILKSLISIRFIKQ